GRGPSPWRPWARTRPAGVSATNERAASATSLARRRIRPSASVRAAPGGEIAEHPARATAVSHQATLVHGPHAVHPDAVEPHRGRVEPARPRRQVVAPPPRAPGHPRGCAQQETGAAAPHDARAVLEALGAWE